MHKTIVLTAQLQVNMQFRRVYESQRHNQIAFPAFALYSPLAWFICESMSFLQQLEEGETPALTLEETLAFLDSFDNSDFSSSCPSGCNTTSSPPYDGDVDDDMDDVLGGGSADSTATTAVGGSSGSECPWSDSDDGLGCVMSAAKASSVAQTQAKMMTAPPAPSRTTAPSQSKPRQKRKAAASASASVSVHASPRGGLALDDVDAFDDADSRTAAAGKRRTRKQPKTEILRLRDQVEELQARLMQLQKAGGGPSGQLVSARSNNTRTVDKTNALSVRAPNSQNASMWLDHAVDQYKALQKSEALNEKLKAEVKRQSSLGKMLKTLFKKKTAQQVCYRDLEANALRKSGDPCAVFNEVCALCIFVRTRVLVELGNQRPWT